MGAARVGKPLPIRVAPRGSARATNPSQREQTRANTIAGATIHFAVRTGVGPGPGEAHELNDANVRWAMQDVPTTPTAAARDFDRVRARLCSAPTASLRRRMSGQRVVVLHDTSGGAAVCPAACVAGAGRADRGGDAGAGGDAGGAVGGLIASGCPAWRRLRRDAGWHSQDGAVSSVVLAYVPMQFANVPEHPTSSVAVAEPFRLALVRDHAALLFVDVVESVRLMQRDEDGFVHRWLALLQRLREHVLPELGGRMVKSHGDGALLAFPRVADAALAAFRIHDLARELDTALPSGPTIELRAGIHPSAVVVDAWDLFGHGVNLAARLATLAAPGETLVSAEGRELLVDGLGLCATDTGEHWLKHIDQPVRVYRLQRLDAAAQYTQATPHCGHEVRPGIAVLPFAAAWGSDNCPGLGQAVADDITAALSRAAGWRVISRLSSAQCHDQQAAPSLAALLGVPYLLGGRFRANGNALQLQVELTDGRNGELLWAEHYRLAIDDLFACQDQALHEVVRTVGRIVLHTELARTQSLPFSRLEDYSIHLAAITLMHRLNPPDQQRALAMIDALEERHHRSAEPAAMRTRWHALRMVQGRASDPKGEGLRALACAREALARDTQHPFAQPMCAMLAAQMGEPLLPAVAQAQHALAAHPQEPMAGLALALLCGYCGDVLGFERHSMDSAELTPLDPALYVYLGLLASAKLAVGKFEEAASAAQRAIRVNATFAPAHLTLSLALEMSGQRAAALLSAERLLSLEPEFSVSRWLSKFHGRGPPDLPARGLALRALGLPD